MVSPRIALTVVQIPIAIGIQSLILFASPFPRWQRLAIATGFFVLIDYGAISRSLGLGVLLTALAMAARRHRIGWVAIVLMPATDMLFGVFSIGFLAGRLLRGRAGALGPLLWLAVAACSAMSVRPASDMKPAFEATDLVVDLATTLWRLGSLLLPLQMHAGRFEWNQSLAPTIGVPTGIGFLWLAWRVLGKDVTGKAIFTSFGGYLILFSSFVYPLSIRHLSLLLWLLLLLKWRSVDRGATSSKLFVAWIAIGSSCGLAAAVVNLTSPFDTADVAAAYIADHDLIQERWIVFPDSIGGGGLGPCGRPVRTTGQQMFADAGTVEYSTAIPHRSGSSGRDTLGSGAPRP